MIGKAQWRASALALALTALPFTAVADKTEAAAKHVTRGQALAEANDYAGAVKSFKDADAATPRTEHACLIALAYIRQGGVGQAELFFDLCNKRATKADPLPAWAPKLGSEIEAQLPRWVAVQVTVTKEHGAAATALTASAYEADETFGPRTIYVKPGELTLTATQASGAPISESITVKRGERNSVTIDLSGPESDTDTSHETGVAIDDAGSTATPSDRGGKRRGMTTASWLAFGTGGVALIAGATFHVRALSSKTKLEDASTPAEYQLHEDGFDQRRTRTFISYGVAVAAITTGALLYARKDTRARSKQTTAPLVSGSLLPSGGMVVVQWSR